MAYKTLDGGVYLGMNKASLQTLSVACWVIAVVPCVSFAERGSTAPQLSQTSATNHVNLKRGLAFVAERNWDKALVEFDAAIEINPKDATAYECRGCAYLMKNDLEKSVTDLSRSIQLNPTNSSAYFNRGAAYRAKEEFAKAVSDFSTCIRFTPSNHLAFKSRAAVYSRMGDCKNAIKDFNEGLRLHPEDADAHRELGVNYRNSGRFIQAMESCRESLRLLPKQADVLNQLAWIQATCPVESARNGREAVKAATEACELTNWQSLQFIDTLAAAFAEAGDFVSAVKYQKRAVELGDANEALIGQMKERLLSFEKNQPFRETINAPLPN